MCGIGDCNMWTADDLAIEDEEVPASARGRLLGIDVGRRRIGLAISDPAGLLARPLMTLTVEPSTAVDRVAAEIDRLAGDAGGLAEVVVGLPVRLDGSRHELSAYVSRFVAALRRRTGIRVVEAEERLSSREAESRLAATERDWRKRKQRLDAAAAAVILQDYLDYRDTRVNR
jgi:putative Holliday junction resolvase